MTQKELIERITGVVLSDDDFRRLDGIRRAGFGKYGVRGFASLISELSKHIPERYKEDLGILGASSPEAGALIMVAFDNLLVESGQTYNEDIAEARKYLGRAFSIIRMLRMDFPLTADDREWVKFN